MSLSNLDDVFGYQDANEIKQMQYSNVQPVNPGSGELWMDTSSSRFTIQRYSGLLWQNVTIEKDTSGNGYLDGVKILTTDDIATTSNSYSGSLIIDNNTPGIFQVLVEASTPTTTIELIGTNFPTYIYTELPNHTHTDTLALASGTVTVASHTHTHVHNHGSFSANGHNNVFTSHTHTTNNHRHGISDTSGNNNANHDHSINGTSGNPSQTHTHAYDACSQPYWDYVSSGVENVGHFHDTSGTTGNQSSGHTHEWDLTSGYTSPSISSVAGSISTSATSSSGTQTSLVTSSDVISATIGTSLSGSLGSSGITGNTLNDTLKDYVTPGSIKIYMTTDMASWGSGYNSSDYPELLDIDTTTGTGTFDISARLSVGMNYIKIEEQGAKKGGMIRYHVKVV